MRDPDIRILEASYGDSRNGSTGLIGSAVFFAVLAAALLATDHFVTGGLVQRVALTEFAHLWDEVSYWSSRIAARL